MEGVTINEKFTEDPKKYFQEKLMTAIFRKVWSKISKKLDDVANMHAGKDVYHPVPGTCKLLKHLLKLIVRIFMLSRVVLVPRSNISKICGQKFEEIRNN